MEQFSWFLGGLVFGVLITAQVFWSLLSAAYRKLDILGQVLREQATKNTQ